MGGRDRTNPGSWSYLSVHSCEEHCLKLGTISKDEILTVQEQCGTQAHI